MELSFVDDEPCADCNALRAALREIAECGLFSDWSAVGRARTLCRALGIDFKGRIEGDAEYERWGGDGKPKERGRPRK